MARLEWLAVASIDLKAIATVIFITAIVDALLILVSSTALFFYYLLATVRRILGQKR
jgi:hypothetical protein